MLRSSIKTKIKHAQKTRTLKCTTLHHHKASLKCYTIVPCLHSPRAKATGKCLASLPIYKEKEMRFSTKTYFFLQYKSPSYKVGHLSTRTEGKKEKKKTNITYHLKLLQLTKRHPQKVIVQNSYTILNMARKNKKYIQEWQLPHSFDGAHKKCALFSFFRQKKWQASIMLAHIQHADVFLSWHKHAAILNIPCCQHPIWPVTGQECRANALRRALLTARQTIAVIHSPSRSASMSEHHVS